MRIVVLHDAVSEDARPDERDTLVQAKVICEALIELGHESTAAQCSLDLQGVADALRRARPAMVFNLVESVCSHGRLIHFAPALLDYLRIPYTGVPTEGMFITSNKLLAKQLLASNGIATPPWVTVDSLKAGCDALWQRRPARANTGGTPVPQGVLTQPLGNAKPLSGDCFIIKPVWEDASLGMDDTAVVEVSEPKDLARELAAREDLLGGPAFAELYVDGREFDLSLLGGRQHVEVLPLTEIEFVGYADDKPKIVGYAAKWEEQSYEYSNTPRRFDFPPKDGPLLTELADIARQCWSVFGLRGYGRVDFRVDRAGKPWVLEINANPCLSPDAGFFAAAQRAGMTYPEVVERILSDVRPCPTMT